MGKTTHQGPGTAGPYGKKKRGDRDMQNFPTQIPTPSGQRWVVKKLPSERDNYNV